MTLSRTVSYLSLADCHIENQSELQLSSPSSFTPNAPSRVPYSRTLRHYKEQKERRKHQLNRSRPEFTITPAPSPSPPKASPPTPKASPTPMHCPRASSPLAPNRKPLPPRASFPRSKQEPDLYRVAIKTRMRCSQEGEKILLMGPRMALSILSATKELEKIVASQMDVDRDLSMAKDDWEMLGISV
ncbi:hypothetical protein SERLADRAFT_389564 [Serpula lacrymans var. lacrymans S7.9]|nr:uncharacterized protein SERLADRAFT_389564 [Serpula lacrymans var. lacrymans S7.9]EGO24408.1 hypothetical protein SERLADRAFT_389564 [Serpula lacrymans var. lacrymans S7.9]